MLANRYLCSMLICFIYYVTVIFCIGIRYGCCLRIFMKVVFKVFVGLIHGFLVIFINGLVLIGVPRLIFKIFRVISLIFSLRSSFGLLLSIIIGFLFYAT